MIALTVLIHTGRDKLDEHRRRPTLIFYLSVQHTLRPITILSVTERYERLLYSIKEVYVYFDTYTHRPWYVRYRVGNHDLVNIVCAVVPLVTVWAGHVLEVFTQPLQRNLDICLVWRDFNHLRLFLLIMLKHYLLSITRIHRLLIQRALWQTLVHVTCNRWNLVHRQLSVLHLLFYLI
jgi:hypothetical protein